MANASSNVNSHTQNNSKCDEQQEDMEILAFWVEGVLEMIIGIIGFVANIVAILLLTRLIIWKDRHVASDQFMFDLAIDRLCK